MKVVSEEVFITDYERAVCYYTLPKVISPITVGLLAAYALCVIEALAALAFGLYTNNRTWMLAGLYCFVAIIVFGMIAFTVRALMNDWRRRVALAEARNAPAAAKDEEVPDPFENHVLVCRRGNPEGDVFACVNRQGDISHYVEIKRYNIHWHVSDAQNRLLFDVRAVHGPGHLAVYVNKEKIASIERRSTLRANVAKVFLLIPVHRDYHITSGCIYFAGRMVGRIYRLRRHLYLDVERDHMNDGLMAHFASLV